MQTALRLQTTILSGGKIEVTVPELAPGKQVEVIILLPESSAPARRSAADIISQAAGHRLFQTAEQVATYLHGERDAWDS